MWWRMRKKNIFMFQIKLQHTPMTSTYPSNLYDEAVNDEDVPLFSYANTVCDVKVVDVYDGDTFTGCFMEQGIVKKYKFRCLGYDSNEMRQPKAAHDREEAKAKALEDKQYFHHLVEVVSNGTMVVPCTMHKFDKYGRILVELPEDGSINRAMVANGHGYEYHGGTKKQ